MTELRTNHEQDTPKEVSRQLGYIAEAFTDADYAITRRYLIGDNAEDLLRDGAQTIAGFSKALNLMQVEGDIASGRDNYDAVVQRAVSNQETLESDGNAKSLKMAAGLAVELNSLLNSASEADQQGLATVIDFYLRFPAAVAVGIQEDRAVAASRTSANQEIGGAPKNKLQRIGRWLSEFASEE